jgi:hypothetical protein
MLLLLMNTEAFRLRLHESYEYRSMISMVFQSLNTWMELLPSTVFEVSLRFYEIMLLCDRDNQGSHLLSEEYIHTDDLVRKLPSAYVRDEDKSAIFKLFEHILGSQLLRNRFMYVALEKPTEGTVQSLLT